MSQRESNAFKRVKSYVCRPGDRFERVENGLGAGWPDSNYCLTGYEGWIEFKAPPIPTRDSTGLLNNGEPLSLDQSNWALSQSNAGGRVFLFIATDRYLFLMGHSHMIEYKRLNAMTMTQLEKECLWGSAVPVADATVWVTLRGILCGAAKPYRAKR